MLGMMIAGGELAVGGGPVLYEEAIDEGLLVDVSKHFGDLCAEARYPYPVVMTSAVFEQYVELSPAAERLGWAIRERMWAILWTLRDEIDRAWRERRKASPLVWSLCCTTTSSAAAERITLRAEIERGDDFAPIVTIMLPSEPHPCRGSNDRTL